MKDQCRLIDFKRKKNAPLEKDSRGKQNKNRWIPGENMSDVIEQEQLEPNRNFSRLKRIIKRI